MFTIGYLNLLTEKYTTAEAVLAKFKEELGVKASNNPLYPELYVLNYDQIESPKFNLICDECRSLVVSFENGQWQVVSRAFDRFYNYGEGVSNTPNLAGLCCAEKLDGSIVSVFYTKKYGWLYRTRSMIMPEGCINGFEKTWKEFIEEALNWQEFVDIVRKDQQKCTLIFEVVGRENRVVVRYEETKAFLLAVRENSTGKYQSVLLPGVYDTPRKYWFKTTEECIEAVKNLPNMEEGYVVYNTSGAPLCKVKSPSYLIAHRIKGEGLTPNRIRELVVINEHSEYLAIFPEDAKYFEKTVEAWARIQYSITKVWEETKHIESQKDFALAVKDYPFSAVLFQARKGAHNPLTCLYAQRMGYQVEVLAKEENS